LNKSIKILINWIIGPLLACWLFYSLYKQVNQQQGIAEALALIKQAPFGEYAFKFWLVVLLSIANWGIEAVKWKLLVSRIQKISWFRALQSVLSGVTFSLNTPNRIGEYGGRMLFIEEGKRLQSVSLAIAGGIAQLIVTLLLGSFGLFYLVIKMDDNGEVMGLSKFWVETFMGLSFFGTALFILFFFKLSWLIKIIDKLPYANKFEKYINVLENFDVKVLLTLLQLSFLRYIIFVFQYVLLFEVLKVQISLFEAFWIVTVLFWVLAVVPTIAIAELGIRGKFAVALLKLYSNNIAGIIGTTFGIWFINLFLPAIIGSILILGKKIFKEK
jgi:hypothetical protein